MPIAPIPPIAPTVATPALTPSGATGGAGFGQALQQAIAGLNSLETGADTATTALAAGNTADLATAVVAAEKANLGLELAVQVRNRAISAYQQIMQMQI